MNNILIALTFTALLPATAEAGEVNFQLEALAEATIEECVVALEKGTLMPANQVHDINIGSVFTIVFDGRFFQYFMEPDGSASCEVYSAKPKAASTP